MHRLPQLASQLTRLLAAAWWDAWLDFWTWVGDELVPKSGLDELTNFGDAGGAPNAEIAGGDF